MVLSNILGARVAVAFLDQQPLLFRSLASCTAARFAISRAIPGPHQGPRSAHLVTVELDIQLTVAHGPGWVGSGRINDAIGSTIPHDYSACAVVARGNNAFEIAVLERMIFDHDGQPLVLGIKRWSLGHSPRSQHALHLETEVVVESPSGVLLYHETGAAARGDSRFRTEWLRCFLCAAFLAIGLEGHFRRLA